MYLRKKILTVVLGLMRKKFLEVLDKHFPLKRKLLKANHASYVSESLRIALI